MPILCALRYVSEESSPFNAKHSAQIMFMMAISVVWFGCNGAAKEIVKEQTILARECDVNLLIPSYLASKVLLLGVISLLQVTLLFIIVKFGTAVPGGIDAFLLLTTLGISGVTLGLLISAASQSTDIAATIVPLVLIPQIILSGAMANVDGLAQLLAIPTIVAYWGCGGLVACLPSEMIQILGYDDWSVSGSFFMVMIHAGVYLIGALLVLQFSESRETVYETALGRWLHHNWVNLCDTIMPAVKDWQQKRQTPP